MCNNTNLDLVNINAYAKFGQNPSIRSQDLEWKRILTSIKVHNSVINLCKLICNNPNLDLVDSNTYAKFGWNPSLRSQDIEGRNSVINLRKSTCNSPNLDFADTNAKSGQILSIHYQDIERKQKFWL